MNIPEINFLYIKAGDGTTGSSGFTLESDWKYNFNQIKDLFNDLFSETDKRIISLDIQEIKIIDDIAYYTTDNGATWVSLGPSFANLSGKPEDNQALMKKLSEYVTNSTFVTLTNRVTDVENKAENNQGTLVIIEGDVNTLKEQINTEGTGLISRVQELENGRFVSSTSVIEIREFQPGILQYTIDGTEWFPVASSVGIDWGEIGGNILNQTDLMNEFDKISSNESDLDIKIDNHINNTNNPHAITPTAIGLGNVNNTSDEDKPVSIAQQEAINAVAESAGYMVTTQIDYEAITSPNSSIVYRLTDVNQ